MTQRGPVMVPGFESPETFNNNVDAGRYMLRMLPLLAAIFVVAGGGLACLFAALLDGSPLGLVLGLLLAAGLCAILFVTKKKQVATTFGAARLELSPWGATQSDPNMRTEIPWGAITQIGPTQMMNPLRAGNRTASAAAAASVRRIEEGLIGAGSVSLAPNAPATLRAQVAQNEQVSPRDPATGHPLRAIVLTQYEQDWRAGRIGQWVRAYRPDLLHP